MRLIQRQKESKQEKGRSMDRERDIKYEPNERKRERTVKVFCVSKHKLFSWNRIWTEKQSLTFLFYPTSEEANKSNKKINSK